MSKERERHARFLCRMWDDEDWKALSPRAQWFYMLLVSQASINRAGIIALTSKRWMRLASGPAVEQQIGLAMDELEATRFLVIDRDTEEVLVRSYMRGDGVEKQPNVLKAACRQATEVLSVRLRAALEVELRRLETPTNDDAAGVLAATIRTLSKGSQKGSPDPSRNGSKRRSPENAPPPAETSKTEPLVEPLSEPFAEPRGVGEGEASVPKGSTSVVGSVGRPRSSTKRGARLPDDFSVTPEMAAWAHEKTPDVNVARATEMFVDYWQDKSGKDATKVSWLGTWRNWMRREQEKSERNRPPNGYRSPTDANISAFLGADRTPHLLALPGGAS